MSLSPDHRAAAWAPILGAAVAIGMQLMLRSLFEARLLAEVVIDASTQGLQPQGFSFLISLLGVFGKPLLFTTVVLGEIAGGVAAWRIAERVASKEPPLQRGTIAGALLAGGIVLFTIALVLTTAANLGSQTSWLGYVAAIVASSLVYGLVTSTLVEADTDAGESDRRALLLRIPVLALGAASFYLVGSRIFSATNRQPRASHPGETTREVTPNSDYYIVSKNLIDPVVDGKSWRLRIGGATTKMVELTYDDLLALPSVEEYVTMQCISNEVGGDLMSNALWKGVRASVLLGLAGPLGTAKYVAFRSTDDYEESLPLDFMLREPVVFAYEMNGERLPDKHGFPMRLLAPGKYGMKHPKWITEIALMDAETFGYWERRDWNPNGDMNTSSRIDVPAPRATLTETGVQVQGVAFAGDCGISAVSISTDGGGTWNDAVLKPPLSPYSWVLWHYDWTTTTPGRTQIFVRATDGRGDEQTAEDAPPYPSGATGYPTISVTVRQAT